VGFTLHRVFGNPLPRRWSPASLFALGRLLLRVPQSAALLRRLKPDIIIGTGGYVSANLLLTASLLQIPAIIVELNAIPGRTTRWLAKRLSRIILAFAEAKQFLPEDKTVVVGVPVRRAILEANRETARRDLVIPPADQVLLVFGGSQAAHRINVALFAAVGDLLSRFPHLHVLHLCGDRDIAEAESILHQLEVSEQKRYRPLSYCHRMETVLAAADLTVSRAGGSSIGELTARGLPAILIPYPHATDNHQTANARAVEKAGGAIIVPDVELDGKRLAKEVSTLLTDEQKRVMMARASFAYGNRHAAQEVVNIALSTVQTE